MDRSKMISAFRITCTQLYNQVSELHYYKEQGPYLMALDETNGECEFHCYEFVDAETFLNAPEEFSPAFSDPDFFFQIADTLNLDGIKESLTYYSLTLRKVVPDLPECRLAAQKIKEKNRRLFYQIIFWNETAEMTSTINPESIFWN